MSYPKTVPFAVSSLEMILSTFVLVPKKQIKSAAHPLNDLMVGSRTRGSA